MSDPSQSLSIKPLGGVSQIGSNMTLISCFGENIIIDCGILFPYEDCFDINYLIPDLAALKKSNIQISSIFLTHGHEDHIGAISHFIDQFPDTKLYAPKFAAKLMEEKLKRLDKKVPITIFSHLESFKFNEFEIRPIHVNHSIPDTYGLLLNCPRLNSSVFYCSDFKVDLEDFYEPKLDLQGLAKLMEGYKNRIALTDSTNILSSNTKTLCEKELLPDLTDIFEKAPGRIFFTTFASNIYRLQSVFNIAKDMNKKVVLHGASINKYIKIAKEINLLKTYSLERSADQVEANNPNLIIILSGCQGDFKSAVRRVAMGEDSTFKLNDSDTFLFSSKTIPGNAKKIGLLYNSIVEQGVDLFFPERAKIHASGHAGSEDLALLYNAIKPTHIFPIHGESLFLKHHVEFIENHYPKAATGVFYNHDSILIDNSGLSLDLTGKKVEPILIHGKGLEIERPKISERRKIAQNGAFILSVSRSRSRLDIQFYAQGIPDHFIPKKEVLESTLKSVLSLKRPEEEARIRLRRLFNESLGYKPTTHVFIH